MLLSADLGELSPDEPHIWPLIDAANVACGGHVGDEQSMADAVRYARAHRVRLGAHPSYPDREHFGRRSLDIAPEELRRSLVEQIAAIREIAESHGVRLEHVKPHGALYNDAHRDRARAGIIVDAMRDVGPELALVAPDASRMAEAARAAGMRVIREAFADRRYEPDGSLVSRREPDALLDVDDAAQQSYLLASAGIVIARDASRIRVPHDTICIHADMPDALARLRAIRARLTQ